MKLHEDRDSFKALITAISAQIGIREDIIEKDYYLTLLLSEISSNQDELHAYFKGGTALYKAIGRMIRFSEDIDLTVEIRDCISRSQGKKRLEKAAAGYHGLRRTDNKDLESNNKGSVTCAYDYVPSTSVDKKDQLQRFGHVKVEATSFTISEPFEPMKVSALLYSEAPPEQQQILVKQYNVTEFTINTIILERIFADKILAAEFYYERDKLIDVSKHLFDLTIMMDMDRIYTLMQRPDKLVEMLKYKREEETYRIGSNLSKKPFLEFRIFNELDSNIKLKNEFDEMQRIYVFNDNDILPFTEMKNRMYELNQLLLLLDEGLDQDPEENQFHQML